jgi:NADH-quinone oxidoreductase subunit J
MVELLAQQAGGGDTAEVVLFWVLSVVAVGGAIAMVTFRNVVHGALMLVLNFFAIAGLFLVLQSSFLAAVQLIVYAGAIMVLFLFVIMLLGVSRDDLLVERDRWARVGAWALGLLLVAAVAFVFVGPFTGEASVCPQAADGAAAAGAAGGTVPCTGLAEQLDAAGGSVDFAAQRLFTRYTFAFEFVSLLLIVAVVGALLVGRRTEPPARPGGVPLEGFEPAAPIDRRRPAPAPAATPHAHGGTPTSDGGPG